MLQSYILAGISSKKGELPELIKGKIIWDSVVVELIFLVILWDLMLTNVET